MKRMEPNLRQPIESGDLLYDLVLAQQADEEELKNTFYQNQTLEDFSGGRMEFQNCVFRGCQFVRCRLDNFSCWKTATSPEAPCATWRPSG